MLCLRSILYLFDNKVDLVMNFAFNQINGAFHDIMVPFIIIITRYLSGHMVYLWPYVTTLVTNKQYALGKSYYSLIVCHFSSFQSRNSREHSLK